MRPDFHYILPAHGNIWSPGRAPGTWRISSSLSAAGAGLAASAAIFVLTRNVNRGTFGFEGLVLGTVPAGLYRDHLTAYLGFPGPGFFSTDYFSLAPWLFLFLSGYFLYRLCGEKILDAAARVPDCRPLSALGRRSLAVYLLHQPVIYGALYLLFAIAGR